MQNALLGPRFCYRANHPLSSATILGPRFCYRANHPLSASELCALRHQKHSLGTQALKKSCKTAQTGLPRRALTQCITITVSESGRTISPSIRELTPPAEPKTPSESLQAQDPKRNSTSQSSQGKVPKRKVHRQTRQVTQARVPRLLKNRY